jgi:peptidoglycan/LPS O-acetylase OafA/YrhL
MSLPATDGIHAANVDPEFNPRAYRPELDAVRFLAFLFVFLFHALPFPVPSDSHFRWRIELALVESGGLGLCLFFALSAYLITSLLLSERKQSGVVSVRKFYVRRILRIWPLYFLGIALGICIALLLHRPADVTGFIWFLLFAGNFYCSTFGWIANPMSQLWTISIEEQFYLIWPWAIRYLSRRALIVSACVFIVAANIALCILRQKGANADTAIWASTVVQFQMFAAGILLALAHRRPASRNSPVGGALIFTCPALWLAANLMLEAKQPAAGVAAISAPALMAAYGLIALGCVAMIQGFCMLGPALMPRWAVYLGKRSYGLYVYHVMAISLAKAVIPDEHNPLLLTTSVVVALVLTISAAAISYALYESPFLRLKRRFEIVHSRPI